MTLIKRLGLVAALSIGAQSASAEQFVVKTAQPIDQISPRISETLKISEVERFEADGVAFIILDAKNDAYLEAFLYSKAVTPLAISKVDFINSPVIGGGEAASPDAAEGHRTFVIERPIPGVGSFPLEKKEGISRASNAAIAELDGAVEWVHSYLTDVGTFCIYRAADETGIEDHARISGAPLGPITEVTRMRSE